MMLLVFYQGAVCVKRVNFNELPELIDYVKQDRLKYPSHSYEVDFKTWSIHQEELKKHNIEETV